MENREQGKHPQHVEIFVDQKQHKSPNPTTGEALYGLGEVPAGFELYREVRGDREDQPIADGPEAIHLTEFEHFHSGPARSKEFTIIVNARKKEVASKELTFDEVVALAFNPVPSGPNIVITVTYRHGPRENPEGILAKGERVWIKNGMVFNVKATDRS
ncbi:MAG: multiubiquitin domain-containing protein [Acidobacteriaceae bacterium]